MSAVIQTKKSVKILKGLQEIADDYEGFILDLWGVVYDGRGIYPGVIECLTELKEKGKKVCLLSNAPRRAHTVISKFEALGLSRNLYTDILTSGEATWMALQARDTEFYKGLTGKCYHLGPEKNRSIFEEFPFEMAKTPKEASFMIASDAYTLGDPLEKYTKILGQCFKAGLPMICPNPDKVVVNTNFDTHPICPGTFAEYYKSLGGKVQYYGKPFSDVYEICFKKLGITDKSKILAVGDSLETDIAGANAAGIDSALTFVGLHAVDIWETPPEYVRPLSKGYEDGSFYAELLKSDSIKITHFLKSKEPDPKYLFYTLLW